MLTLVPYPDFTQSARVLERRHLNRQRVEAYRILKALMAPTGHENHPTVHMWDGYGIALTCYTIAICDEWVARGHRDAVKAKVIALVTERLGCSEEAVLSLASYDALTNEELFARGGPALPWWVGYEPVHASHRAHLLRQDYEWYKQWGWAEDPRLPYVWPSARTPGCVTTTRHR